MAKAGNTNRFIALKSMFEQGNVTRMKDIEKLFPTAIALELGMNHTRYVLCLYNPENLRAREILLFSSLINVNSNLVWQVIAKETTPAKLVKKKPAPKKAAAKKAR